VLLSPAELSGNASSFLPLAWFVGSTVFCVIIVWADLGGERKTKNERFWVDDVSKRIWSYRGLGYVVSTLFGAGAGLLMAGLFSETKLGALHAIPFAIGGGTLLGLLFCRQIFGEELSGP
jgi:hypothetical protein